MNGHDDLERRLEVFYTTELPVRAPDWVLRGALSTIETTPQRRPLWPAWRIPAMNTRLRIAASVAAVLVIAVIGYQFLPGTGGPGGGPSPSPSLSPSPSPTAEPTPLPTAPPLSQTFDSTIHGISVSYPEGWTTQAATQQATSVISLFLEPHADFMYDPARTDHLFLSLVSVNLGDTPPDDWLADNVARECPSNEAVTVDGAAGVICPDTGVAMVSTGGRGYLIWLYTSGDEGWLDQVYDRAWFDTVLATVQLRPEDAINASSEPSTTPAPS